jgi:glycosyltransferase involved in cell wall biosynthesis
VTMPRPDGSLAVLVVTAMYPHEQRPGSGAFVMQQVECLRALGHTVDVVHIRGYESKWNYLRGAVDVLQATWRSRYDVVHAHYGLTGVFALARWRAPLVVTLHGSDVLQGILQPLMSSLVSTLADATIAVSPAIAARCPGTVIPCGVDLETFRPIDRHEARRQLGLKGQRKLVLFPFDPERRVKRYDLAEAAVELLQAQDLNVSLLPVWGVPNEKMPLYYSAADVMVLCSDSEGSPTSIKEALGCGLPVVSTDVGDVRSITGGIAGTEICEANARALAVALARALERTEPISSEARAAMRRFDQKQTVQAVVEVYRAVLRRPAELVTSRNFN